MRRIASAWAFLVVILSGLGKVENTLAAGLVVGLIQTVCTALLPFDYVYLVLYLLLAAILILRREGLSRAARRALPVFSVFLIPPVRRSAAVGVLVWAFWLTVLAGLILYGAFGRQLFILSTLGTVFLYFVLTQSWNILGGYGGYLNFGRVTFFGVGAYASAILFHYDGLSPFLIAPLTGLAAALAGLLIGVPTLRLRGGRNPKLWLD